MTLETTEQRVAVRLNVNDVAHHLEVPSRRLLSDVLRHDLGLTGTHVGCEHGVCGCCTVLVDGRAARSCLMFAWQAEGCAVTTIEGIHGEGGELHPVQQALHECHGLQCGYCTPGFVMSIIDALTNEEELDLSDGGIREMISGNLCRCTGYQGIVASVRKAAEWMARDEPSELAEP